MNDRVIATIIAVLGTAAYVAVAFGLWDDVDGERVGTIVYNYYFLSLIEGRFDVPLRLITLEGHFDPSGRAFVYHGIAPLITRAIAWPFIDLTAVSLAPLTVCVAAVGGTAAYHLVFVQILARYGSQEAAMRRPAGLLLGVMIWFASPGLLLAANDSIFQEPIAMAYLFVACYLALLAQVVLFHKPIESVLLPMAALAGLCVFARPHLAIGLYAGACLLSLVLLWQNGWRGLARAGGAAAILLSCGVALLIFNDLRFGNMLQWGSGGAVEYGFTYWGAESTDSPRQTARGGVFHPGRIVPNLMLYLFDLSGGSLADGILSVYRDMTSWFGYIRVETPRIGMVFLWLPWFVLALAGIGGRPAGLRHAWAPVLATAIGGLLMASYATVTLRYRFDIWPVLALLAMLALPRVLLNRNGDVQYSETILRGLSIALVPSLTTMMLFVYYYPYKFVEEGLFSRWTYKTCAEMVSAKEGLGPDAVSRLCGL